MNAVDNGGWTPLSEAVSHNQLRNVRLLLERGARVDCRSRECSVNDEGEQIVIFAFNFKFHKSGEFMLSGVFTTIFKIV